MEIKVIARFTGTSRLGYRHGEWYDLVVTNFTVECKEWELPALSYSTIANFLHDWTDINA